MNEHVNATMAECLASWAPFATANPHADAERWESEQEALAERESARKIDLADQFIAALQSCRPAPHGEDMDSALDELVGEHPELFRDLLRAAVTVPAMSAAVAAVADAYIEHFRQVLPDPA